VAAVRRRGEGLDVRRLAVALVIAALAAIVQVPASATGTVVVDAGSLRAEVQADPWRLRLLDDAGREVLAEASGTGIGPNGSLGFRTGVAWQHATRVESATRTAGSYRAVLATTDPLRQITVTLKEAAEGVIALDAQVTGAEAVGMGFTSADGERFLGFGERSHQVEQRGQVVESFVADGPYQTEEYPFLNAFVPPWALRPRPDATYFPIPWLLSTRGYGVLVDNPETSYFRLGTEAPDAWSLEVQAAPTGQPGVVVPGVDRLQLRFFAGPSPAEALRRFTRDTGRQPTPPAWAFGPWFQARGDELAQVRLLQQADAPLSVLQTYLHYLPCGDHQGVESAQPARTAAAHKLGVAITTYFNPMVCANYSAAFDKASDSLTKNRAGLPYLYRYGASPEDSNIVGQYDFFKPKGQQLYGDRLAEALRHGYDGWMEDFGEYTPLDSVSGDGIDGTRAHNPYPTRYHCAASQETKKRKGSVVRFQRSGWTGSAPCADVVWGGDPTTGWGHDGLRSAVHQALSVGTSGISTWGSDIGGFFALGRNAVTPELLTRWVQLGAVSPVMRTQANGVALPPRDRPQVTDAGQLANWRRYAKLHTQLLPYLTAAHEEYVATGLPVMRHLGLVHPDEAFPDDQFLFGPDLLAAPVLDPGVTSRKVQLPEGQWVDLWRAVSYRSSDGGLDLRRAELLSGDREVTVPAPLAELPLLVRAGAVLPMLPPDVDTLTALPGDGRTVRFADRASELRLLAFPRGMTESRFHETGRLLSTEGDGSWRLDVRGGRSYTVRLQASMSTLRHPFVPCRVALDGTPLPRVAWSYAAGTLDVAFRSGALTVTACSAPGGNTDPLPSTGSAFATGVVALLLLTAGLALRRRQT
jgi:alpha-glucosidase (family GH31 glycosyl hydrolase)